MRGSELIEVFYFDLFPSMKSTCRLTGRRGGAEVSSAVYKLSTLKDPGCLIDLTDPLRRASSLRALVPIVGGL